MCSHLSRCDFYRSRIIRTRNRSYSLYVRPQRAGSWFWCYIKSRKLRARCPLHAAGPPRATTDHSCSGGTSPASRWGQQGIIQRRCCHLEISAPPSNVHRSSGWTAGLMPVLCFGFNSKLRAEPLVCKQWAEGSEAQYWPFQPAQLGLFRIFLPSFQKKESSSFLLNWKDVHAKSSFPDSSRNRRRVSLHTFPSLPS